MVWAGVDVSYTVEPPKQKWIATMRSREEFQYIRESFWSFRHRVYRED